MLEEHSNRRTFPVDRHAGVAIAGVAADGRAVVGRAQAEASSYKNMYGDPIPGHVLAERVASYKHLFNLYWYVRPFGVSTLLATFDRDGPQLYLVDPAGTMHRYRGTAVGKGRQGAKNEIEKLKLGEMSCREGISAVAKM
jgi:20S proteasome subunit alpha 7